MIKRKIHSKIDQWILTYEVPPVNFGIVLKKDVLNYICEIFKVSYSSSGIKEQFSRSKA